MISATGRRYDDAGREKSLLLGWSAGERREEGEKTQI